MEEEGMGRGGKEGRGVSGQEIGKGKRENRCQYDRDEFGLAERYVDRGVWDWKRRERVRANGYCDKGY